MKLSVCMTTYNSGAYLEQAIASVLAQEAPFDFGLVIGDNASTDDTHAIVERFVATHPGRVSLTVRPRNIGIGPNFVQTIGERKGEYVAFLDSDDWWTSADKLRLQVEFMEAHPECAFCFHGSRIVEGETFTGRMPQVDYPSVSGVEALCDLSNPVQLGSVVARSSAVDRLPPFFGELLVNDWALCLLMAQAGAVGYLPQDLSAYRVHPHGFWTRLSPTERVFQTLQTLVRLRPALSATIVAALDGCVEGLADWWATQVVFDPAQDSKLLADKLASAGDPALLALLGRVLIDKARHIGVSSAWHESQHLYWKQVGQSRSD